MGNIPALRIGIDATSVGIVNSERGGVYQYVMQVVKHVGAASPDASLQLMFALPHPRHNQTIRQFVAGISNPNVVGRRCPLPTRYLRRWGIPVDPFLGPIDVFHAPAHLSLRCRASPVVVTIHDLSYLHDRGGVQAPAELDVQERRQWEVRRRFFAEIAENTGNSVREARLVIAVSRATRDHLVAVHGVAADKVRVVHLGIRADMMPLQAQACDAVISAYALDTPYWLYVGNLDPNKNLVVLLEGYAQYRQRGGRQSLAMAGHSAFYGTVLRRLVKQLGIADSVLFLGYVPDGHLPALYSAATGVLMPSPFEGFGLPALEAMACGTPVIAANGGSLPEVVGDAGLLVAPDSAQHFAQAMLSIEQDPELSHSLVAAGRRRASLFNWNRTAQETLAVYTEAARIGK